MIDVLNQLEKCGYLMTADWQTQRDLRNALTHEYLDQPERQLVVLIREQQRSPQLNGRLTRLTREANATGPAKST